MHPYLLNLIYALLLLALSPWILFQAIFKQKYREGWSDKLLGRSFPSLKVSNDPLLKRPRIWFHAVSVGEVNLLEPVIARLRTQLPDAEFVFSATTKTGFELARKRHGDSQVFYFPLDFSWAVKNRLKHLQPDLLVLAELEVWPNLIRYCHQKSVKIAVINGRLSEKSYHGYWRVRWLVKGIFSTLDFVGVQNQTYAQRFLDLGVSKTAMEITGSIKFDGASTDRQNKESTTLARLAGIDSDDVVFIAGSTQDPEEQFALSIFSELHKTHENLKLLIVPRHPARFDEVAKLLDASGISWQLRSELHHDQVHDRDSDRRRLPTNPRVILIDTIGELSAWWGTAHIAFVGGSFGSRGGQNMIEPAAYGAAVSFGPNTRNFHDIVSSLLSANAAIRVNSERELHQFVEKCLTDVEFRDQLSERAQQVVTQQQGATPQTVTRLLELIDHPQSPTRKVA